MCGNVPCVNDMDVLGVLGDNETMNNPTAASRESYLVEPPEDLEEMLEFARFLESHSAPALLLGPDGEQVPLPVAVYEVLLQVAHAMEQGISVNVEPVDRQLTTQQAANMLGISRNTLVRLLDEHELPFERFGESRHRRLRLHDVLAYRERKRAERKARLDEMTRQASEDGLYDVAADTYVQALSDARKP